MEDFDAVIIQKGDSLYSLFGPDWKTVYNNDVNQEFRSLCPNPNAIKSGAIIYVPKKKYDWTAIVYSNHIKLDLDANRTRILTTTENITKITSESHLESDKVVVVCDCEIDRFTCNTLNKNNTYIFGCRNINTKLFMDLYDFPKKNQEAIYLFGQNITNGENVSELSEYSMQLTRYPNCSFIQFGTNPKINSYSLSINNELLYNSICSFAKIL